MGPVGPGSHSDPIALEYKVVAKPPLGRVHGSGGPGSQATQVATQAKKQTTHEHEKIALVLFLAGGFAIWSIFL